MIALRRESPFGRAETRFVFPAFARIRPSADAVHRDRQRLVRLFADRAERHRARRKALDDLGGRLHFINRHRARGCLQLHQSAQRTQLFALLVDQLGILLECREAVLPHRVLQLADRQRIEQMVFAANPVLIFAAGRELGLGFGDRLEGKFVLHLRFARQHIQPDAFDARCRAGEIFLHQRLVQADRLEDLRAAIALQRRDAHLREDLQQAFVDGLLVVLERRLKGDTVGQHRLRSARSSSVSIARYGFTALAP